MAAPGAAAMATPLETLMTTPLFLISSASAACATVKHTASTGHCPEHNRRCLGLACIGMDSSNWWLSRRQQLLVQPHTVHCVHRVVLTVVTGE